MITTAVVVMFLVVALASRIAVILLKRGVRYRIVPFLPLAVFIIGGIVAHRTGPKWIALWFMVAIGPYVSFLTLGFILRPILDDHHIH